MTDSGVLLHTSKTRVSHPHILSPLISHHQRSNQPRETQPPHTAPPARRAVRVRLDARRIARGKHDGHARVARRTHLLGGQQRVVEGVARRAVRAGRDAVGDRDGQVEDCVVVFAVETERLADGDL